MKKYLLASLIPLIGFAADNQLSDAEKASGWKLLFNGKNTEGWRSAKAPEFPKYGWTVIDGLLHIESSGGQESTKAGDIITIDKYSKFEVSTDFKLTKGANSGLKYFVQPDLNKGVGSAFGLEFQMLDDENHRDAKLGRDGNRTIGSLYDMITANKNKKPNPIGEWNTALVKTDGKKVEHWLNGMLVVSFDRSTNEFKALVAQSKYADKKYGEHFGEWESGHILLQDHGNEVWFKNIKIKDLSAQ